MDFITAIEKKIGKTVKKNFMEIQPGDVPQTYADVRIWRMILIINQILQ